jgi:hypothetical protein
MRPEAKHQRTRLEDVPLDPYSLIWVLAGIEHFRIRLEKSDLTYLLIPSRPGGPQLSPDDAFFIAQWLYVIFRNLDVVALILGEPFFEVRVEWPLVGGPRSYDEWYHWDRYVERLLQYARVWSGNAMGSDDWLPYFGMAHWLNERTANRIYDQHERRQRQQQH